MLNQIGLHDTTPLVFGARPRVRELDGNSLQNTVGKGLEQFAARVQDKKAKRWHKRHGRSPAKNTEIQLKADEKKLVRGRKVDIGSKEVQIRQLGFISQLVGLNT